MPCLKDILDEVGHVAQYKRIDIHFSSSCPDSVCIQLDSVRLKQIITNLVFNSIKFTHTYGSIFVYAEVLRTGLRKGILDQVLVRVVIEDNGFGFDHQRLPSLTDGANKTEYSTERRLEGAGIGMWLINDIATEALGGRLRVSRFVIPTN
jgi:signal transduction histidine kinase